MSRKNRQRRQQSQQSTALAKPPANQLNPTQTYTLNGQERTVGKSPSGRPVDISRVPATGLYKPIPHIWFQHPIDLPPFTFATIRAMLMDEGIRLNFETRAAPLYGLEFGWEENGVWQEGVKCRDPGVAQFIFRQLQRIWKTFLPDILRAQVWGWSAGEVKLKLSEETGLVEIDEMLSRHPMDCRLLKVGSERWGVQIQRVESGAVDLPFPYSWFHTYGAEDGEDYGTSAAYGAYSPWADKWFEGGAKDVRRLFMHKDAYGGVDLGYPDGETYVQGYENPIPNRDLARQIAESIRAGGVTTRPSDRDEHGNEKWPLTRATVSSNPQHILEYPKDLDAEIRHGMGICDDVINSGETGAWAGKKIPMQSFYATLDSWATKLLRDLCHQIIDHLLILNFGHKCEYETPFKPLAKQAMEQQGMGDGGQPNGQPPDSMGDGNEPGQPGESGQTGIPGANDQPQPQSDGTAKPIGMGLESKLTDIFRECSRVVRLSLDSDGDDSPKRDETDKDYEYTPERIEALAELLASVFGDQAESALDKILPEDKPIKLAVWNPSDHPRGKNGQFIPKGTEEAYTMAKEKVDEAHHSRSPESMSALMSHLNTLTTKQLHSLKRDYGTKASAKTKSALIAKLTERLTSGKHRTAEREDGSPVAPVRENVYTVPTTNLKVDPQRFQYKVKGIGEKGVGDELKGTKTWNPELGGVLLVWRDPADGKDYVVNGHHRHELASRAGAESLNVRYIEAPTAKHARSVGALANIAEGRGSAIDAAKYLRDSGQDIDHLKRAGISMSGKVASDAANLVDLSDKAFAAVAQGKMDEDKAVAVGKHLKDHNLQDKLFKKIWQREDDGKDWSSREIEAAAKKMSRAGSITESGSDLFGDWESEESTFDQEVEIESYINKALAQEANDYGAVASSRRANRVSEAGNVLNVDANLQKRDSARSALADFEREAGLKGPVAEAIKAQAARLARATKKADKEAIKKSALEDVRKLIDAMQEPEPGIKVETRSNNEAKPGDQLGMFGDVANVPSGKAVLDQIGETFGRQAALFDTSGDPDQLMMFDDGVTPEDRLSDEAKASRSEKRKFTVDKEKIDHVFKMFHNGILHDDDMEGMPYRDLRFIAETVGVQNASHNKESLKAQLTVLAKKTNKFWEKNKIAPQAIAMSLSKHTQHYKGLDMPSIWTLTDEEAKQVEAGARTLIRMKDTDQDVIMMSLGKLQEENRLLRMSVDATGHEHKGKGPGGGQFVSKGGGGGGGGDPGKSDSKPNSKSESSKAQGNSQKTEPAPEGKPGGKQAESQAKPVTKDVPATDIDEEQITPPPPGEAFQVDVEKTGPDGVALTARVGIPGRDVAPPPPIPKLPNLTKHERQVEQTFIDEFMQDPDGMAAKYRDLISKTSKPYTFETDGAKCLSDDWNDADLDTQMKKRQLHNNALHQTANAIVKRAFLQHLNTLKPGDNILVTVGGCGAGKGFVLGKTDLGAGLTKEAKAVWDSAGDQNATENPWILEEATKRGLTVTYAHITADPKVAWADPGRGVVKRAHDNTDGRMVDAAVFADSYAMGARNHHAFHQANKNNPNAKFLFFDARKPIKTEGGGISFPTVDQVPEDSLKLDRKSLYHWAMGSIQGRTDVSPTVMRGATQGARIWNEELGS